MKSFPIKKNNINFQVWRYVYAQKFTWYFTGIFIINKVIILVKKGIYWLHSRDIFKASKTMFRNVKQIDKSSNIARTFWGCSTIAWVGEILKDTSLSNILSEFQGILSPWKEFHILNWTANYGLDFYKTRNLFCSDRPRTRLLRFPFQLYRNNLQLLYVCRSLLPLVCMGSSLSKGSVE